jgi:hypothetical protein
MRAIWREIDPGVRPAILAALYLTIAEVDGRLGLDIPPQRRSR